MTTTGTSTAALMRRCASSALGLAAEATGATGVLGERRVEVGRVEVGPEAVAEVELGVGGLPQQEVADALVAAGPDEQVDVRQVRGVQPRGDGRLVDVVGPPCRPRGSARTASTISERAE